MPAESAGAPVAGSGVMAARRAQVDGTYFDEIAIGAITPNPRQPRQEFDEDALDGAGVLDPRGRAASAGRGPQGHAGPVRAGHGRAALACLAARRPGPVPAIVRGTPDDELLREALMENLHREQLNPLEEAAAYQQLLDDFSATHDELARKVGRSRPHISNTIRLLQLPPQVQRRVAAGVLSAGHARALLALADPGEQDRLAHRIVAEGLSVRAVEEIVALGQHQAKPRRPSARQPVAPALSESGGPPVRRARHQGQGGGREAERQDRGGVRLAGGPAADRHHHVPRLGTDPHRLTLAARSSLRAPPAQVDDIDGTVARLRAHGAELLGEVAQYESIFRLCYLRGPAGIIVALAEQIG